MINMNRLRGPPILCREAVARWSAWKVSPQSFQEDRVEVIVEKERTMIVWDKVNGFYPPLKENSIMRKFGFLLAVVLTLTIITVRPAHADSSPSCQAINGGAWDGILGGTKIEYDFSVGEQVTLSVTNPAPDETLGTYYHSVRILENNSSIGFIGGWGQPSSTTIDITPSIGNLSITPVSSGADVAASCLPVGPSNHAPTADAGVSYSGNEGSAILLSGSATDPDGDALAYDWTADSSLCSFDDATTLTPTFTCTDNGDFDITLSVSDGQETAVSNATVTVLNVNPVPGAIVVDQPLVPVNTAVNAEVDFTDIGASDTHLATWDWGDGSICDTSSGDTHCTLTQDAGFGSTTSSHAYNDSGVYMVQVTLTDDDGGFESITYQYVVVYDPEGGFVTGGGWIESPAGAYTPGNETDPDITGKASFGFVSKYKKGASVPTGQTEFQFKAGDLDFHSSSYQWLVVNQNATNAQFKGSGTINGMGDYKFMLWGGDGTPDTFRIRIWEKTNGRGEVSIYDNGVDQPLGGGNIVVHTK